MLVGLSLSLTACGPDVASKAASLENQMLKDRVLALEQDSTRAVNEARAAERSLQGARDDFARKEQEAKAERESLKKKLDESTKAFEEYKTKFRLTSRSRASGQKLAKLVCGEGKEYQDVEVVSLTPGELKFRHAAGLGKVALGQLDPQLREQFGYNPEEAAAWLEAEEKKAEAAEMAKIQTDNLASISKSKKGPSRFAMQQKAGYQASLQTLYNSARALQADRNACPVHKRYQLASWSALAERLKKQIAALP